MKLEKILEKKYGFSPIVLKDLSVDGMTDVNLRKQLQILVEKGVLQRAGRGVYYFPKQLKWMQGSIRPSDETIIERKFIRDTDGNIFGYKTGFNFANSVGLTTQMPVVVFIVSNKATSEYRKIVVGSTKVVLLKPSVKITNENYKILRFLDLLTCMDKFSELEEEELRSTLRNYVQKERLVFKDMEQYLKFYPDSIYKGLYRAGVLNEVAA
ncbi:MAG: type IV toxin-antitoxin system AbiEi family antitoxin domain-containing protein [Phascolarctobacterium sp.]|nr:type IV toxin-antitoxin system AbiEi family antitoxin domain-containing protein [Candidatus Phascolarctobacterium caballi]